VDLLKSKILPFFSKLKKTSIGLFSPIKKLGFFSQNKKTDLVSEEIDKKLVYSLSKTRIPSWCQLRHLDKVLNRQEKLGLRFFLILFFLSGGFWTINFARTNLITTPAFGGEYIEAAVGAPQHVNPLYASANDIDADLSRLIFSSLFYIGEDGLPVNDLASSYEVSPDGKTYTVKLRDDAHWHSGGDLTATDVLFTFNAIKDPAYNSPLRQSLSGIEAEVKDDFTIKFTLSEKYSPFLNLLTFGIIPLEKWKNIAPSSASLAQLNLDPEGSGPYKFKSLAKGRDGSIRSYSLTANRDYYSGRPNIKKILFKFYGDITQAIAALNNGDVSGLNYLPREEEKNLIAKNSVIINKFSLPQMKVVFFNSGNNPALKDAKVRQALSCAVPRADIITTVLDGNGQAVYGPILPSSFAYNENLDKCDFDFGRAETVLGEAGWKKVFVSAEEIASLERKASTSPTLLADNEKTLLSFGSGDWLVKEEVIDKVKKTVKKTFLAVKISYLDDQENSQVAEAIALQWGKLGINVSLNSVSSGQLQSAVIKPRAYEILLFGQQVGSDPDVYAFWHSSQAGKNGLNLSDYRSEEADRALEEGRTASTTEGRLSDYSRFQELIAKDTPAVFLYSPYYLYVQNKKIKNFSLKNIFTPADRFNGVSQWYIKSGWKIK
jgi:peptide/nickel transport system substrate-binding protein